MDRAVILQQTVSFRTVCVLFPVEKKIAVRNPHSTRPYQHVLEPLGAYLLIAEEQYQDSRKAGSYNVGPDDRSCLTTGNLQICLHSMGKQGSMGKLSVREAS